MSDSLPSRSTFRYPVRRVAGWQLLATLGVAAIGGMVSGWHGAVSALLGGFVNISAGAAYAFLTGIGKSETAGGTLRTMFRAEAVKITLIVLQLWFILTTYADVVHAVFFSAFVVTVLVSQAAILIRD